MKAIINDNSICMTAGDQTVELFKLDTELLTNDLEHAAQVMNTMKEYEAALAAAKQKLADLQPKPKQRRRRRTKAEMEAARAAETEAKESATTVQSAMNIMNG